MSFNDLKLIEPVLKALSREGYEIPTPIQEKAIPVILQNRDLLGCAQTGTGKTAAFVIPVLQNIFLRQRQSSYKTNQIKALVLVPTRELAIQVGESIKAYGHFLPVRHQVIFGGVSQYKQVQSLERGADILVATPGRLLDLMQQRYVSLDGIEYFVLDEADRMLDMGFIHDVKRIIAKLPGRRQTLFFSATMPREIMSLANMLLTNPVKAEVTPNASTVDAIRQSVYFLEKHNKLSLLIQLLQDKSFQSVLVFIQMKHHADRLAKNLYKSGIRTEAIHGNKVQRSREQALHNFKTKKTRVLVATDIAARGIDIEDITHVINYDLPNIPQTYVHRIGRTGRAGAGGAAISFCDWGEKILLKEIQRLIRKDITVVKDHPYDIPSMHSSAAANNASASFQGKRLAGGGKKYGRTFSQKV